MNPKTLKAPSIADMYNLPIIPPKQYLYHYTKNDVIDTLINYSNKDANTNIIDETIMEFWLNDIRTVNDKNETKVLLNYVIYHKELITKGLVSKGISTKWISEFIETIEKLQLGEEIGNEIQKQIPLYTIASFTELYDSSTFWNAPYSTFNGICIEFDKDELNTYIEDTISTNKNPCYLQQVTYINLRDHIHVNNIIDIINESYNNDGTNAKISAYIFHWYYSAMYKTRVWEGEREWRIILSVDKVSDYIRSFFSDMLGINSYHKHTKYGPDELLKYKIINGNAKCYIPIKIPKKFIKKLTLGRDVTEVTYQMIHTSCQKYGIHIEQSKG